MVFVEHFHGHVITVTTTRVVEGRWVAAARYELAPGRVIRVDAGSASTMGSAPGSTAAPAAAATSTVPTTYASENLAKSAALEAAAASIDRDRIGFGKP